MRNIPEGLDSKNLNNLQEEVFAPSVEACILSMGSATHRSNNKVVRIQLQLHFYTRGA